MIYKIERGKYMDFESYFNKLNKFYKHCYESSEEHLKFHLIAPLFIEEWEFEAQFNQMYVLGEGYRHILVDLMLGDEVWIETKRMKLEPDIHNASHNPQKRIDDFKEEPYIKMLIMTNGLRWIIRMKHPEGSYTDRIEFTLNHETDSEVNTLFPKIIDSINALKKHSYSTIYQEILDLHEEMISIDKFNQLLKNNHSDMIKTLVQQFGGTEDYYRKAFAEEIVN